MDGKPGLVNLYEHIVQILSSVASFLCSPVSVCSQWHTVDEGSVRKLRTSKAQSSWHIAQCQLCLTKLCSGAGDARGQYWEWPVCHARLICKGGLQHPSDGLHWIDTFLPPCCGQGLQNRNGRCQGGFPAITSFCKVGHTELIPVCQDQ